MVIVDNQHALAAIVAAGGAARTRLPAGGGA
jgi:hypothetical protein